MSEEPKRYAPEIIPERTAEEQFLAAGADSCAIRVLYDGRLLVGGKGGEAVMEQAEWLAYALKVRRWASASIDQAGADAVFLPPPRTPIERGFSSVERLIRDGHVAVQGGDLEELDDILHALRRETSNLAALVAAEKGGPR